MKRILFVCLGNICRSPLAEGLFNHHLTRSGTEWTATADSAGTSGWHDGEPPHEGSMKAANKLGVSLAGQVSRQLTRADFAEFDVILGMDRSNVENLRRLEAENPDAKAQIGLFLDYAGLGMKDVPDPWGHGEAAYDAVAQMIGRATPAIAERLLR
ncbi:low molecular weight protein-tyrosine-phosphatase [Salaquimonas pukyongi]|uniref:low molecular weight protein-tyrosine-phosphatase n=1 Tax=Salaquimonas pukyongi TaxID=2712698 RepID=UPI00096BC695|nr:low molecular weight protein-tyrosine-phosphatase [Salaquimonas pukyongi]